VSINRFRLISRIALQKHVAVNWKLLNNSPGLWLSLRAKKFVSLTHTIRIMEINSKKLLRKAVRGFTLIELLVVLAVIAVLAVLGLPAVQNLAIEGRAPEVAKALQSAIVKVTNNRQSGGAWTTASTAELASILNGNTVVKVVSGGTPSVSHDLNRSGATGVITLAQGSIASGASGAITVTEVDGVACPIVSNALSKITQAIKINTTDVKTVAVPAYNGGAAQTACTETGNTLVFEFR